MKASKVAARNIFVFVQHQPVHRGWKFHTRIPGHFATVLSSLALLPHLWGALLNFYSFVIFLAVHVEAIRLSSTLA